MRKAISAALAAIMTLGSITVGAQTGPREVRLNLPDTPILPSPVKPNIVFTFDNSHTMNYPWVSNLLHPKGGNRTEGPGSAWPLANGTTVKQQTNGLVIANDPSIYSSSVNLLYYNPEIKYRPGLRPDGTPMPEAGDGPGQYSPTAMPNEPYRQMFGGPSGPDSLSTNLTSYCAAGIGQPGYPGGAIALTALDHVLPINRPYEWKSIGSLSGTGPNATLDASTQPVGRIGSAPNIRAVGVNRPLQPGTYCVWNGPGEQTQAVLPPIARNPDKAYRSPQVAMFAFHYRYLEDLERCPRARTEQERLSNLRNSECFARVDIIHPRIFTTQVDRDPSIVYEFPTAYYISLGSERANDCPIDPGNASRRSCSYETEIRNFANWWSYHRTRSLAMKTAMGRAIHQLPADAPFRVGFNATHDERSEFNDALAEVQGSLRWLSPEDWSPEQRIRFLTALYTSGSSRLSSASGSKETVRSSIKVGTYLAGGGGDPFSCSGGMHVILSDGASIDPRVNDLVGLDRGVPYAGPSDGDYDKEANNPNPFVDRAIGAVDVRGKAGALSDAAMFFYSKNLGGASGRPATDPFAEFRKVQTSVIGVGFDGFRRYKRNYDIDPDSFISRIAQGTDFWDPLDPKNYLSEDAARSAEFGRFPWKSTVDDYWHAAVNGRGLYYGVPAFDAEAWRRILPNILATTQSAQSISRAGSTLTRLDLSGATYAYAATYAPGIWAGDLTRRLVSEVRGDDLASRNPYEPGSLIPGASSGAWSARQILDRQVMGDGWQGQRRIFTPALSSTNTNAYRVDRAIPFTWNTLGEVQRQRILASAWPTRSERPIALTGERVIAFLRGNRADEIGRGGASLFRYRTAVLGSIINSGAAYVDEPAGRSTDPGYAEFRDAKGNRGPMVYVGANDGMLHAFDAKNGRERWAFMPAMAFFNNAGPRGDTGIGSQSIADDPGRGLQFRPYAYVDGSPVVADVDMACAGRRCPATAESGYTPQWRTILAGGLGKGGRSVYALDVTEGANDDGLSEEALGNRRFLWEFSDERMGFTFGEPLVAKTARWGWVVMVASGYNASEGPRGEGYVFVLNARTGDLLHTVRTGEAASIAKIAGYSSKLANQEVQSIYAGDLQGNLWRWDLANADTDKAVKIASLQGPDGKRQPVTTRPRVEVDDRGNRYVFVGTGKLLEPDDLRSTDVHSLYAIRDGAADLPALGSAVTRSSLAPVQRAGIQGVNAPAGWYMDLAPGEHIVVEPRFDFGSIFYAASKPAPDDPCGGGTTTRLYGRAAVDAKSVLVEGASATSAGTLAASIVFPGGIAKIDGLLVRASPSLRVTDGRGIGRQVRIAVPGKNGSRGRIAWREL